MKLLPYTPACYDPEWPLATARLMIHIMAHSVDGDHHSCCAIVDEYVVETIESDLIFSLPQWAVRDGAILEEFLDATGTVIHNDQTAELFTGWTENSAQRCREAGYCGECDIADIIQVLSIRPVINIE